MPENSPAWVHGDVDSLHLATTQINPHFVNMFSFKNFVLINNKNSALNYKDLLKTSCVYLYAMYLNRECKTGKKKSYMSYFSFLYKKTPRYLVY